MSEVIRYPTRGRVGHQTFAGVYCCRGRRDVCRPPSSQKAYQPQPKEWLYDTPAPVLRLNTQGCLNWAGRRFFVSEALAHERVQVHAVDNILAVKFRHMWIREIDLTTGQSNTMIDKNYNPYV